MTSAIELELKRLGEIVDVFESMAIEEQSRVIEYLTSRYVQLLKKEKKESEGGN